MKRALYTALLLVAACWLTSFFPAPQEARFGVLDVHVDARGESLAAYQFELRMRHAVLVGVEGGEGAFSEPPRYDPAALRGGRVKVGAFTTSADVPTGRVHVARLHVMYTDEEAYTALDVAAARRGGSRIPVETTIQRVD